MSESWGKKGLRILLTDLGENLAFLFHREKRRGAAFFCLGWRGMKTAFPQNQLLPNYDLTPNVSKTKFLPPRLYGIFFLPNFNFKPQS